MNSKRSRISKKGLSSKLWLLSKNIVAKVNEYKGSKKIVKIKRLYVKPKVEKFEYKKGGTSYTKSFKYVEKQEWHWKDQFDFIEKVVKRLPEYSEILEEISKKYKVTEPQADFWLSRFAQFLLQKAPEGVTDEDLVEDTAIFVADLEKSPVEWKPKIWIRGVWLEDEEYEIHEGLRIRRPRPSDVEIERPFEMIPFQVVAPGFSEFPSAILELTYRSKSPIEIQEEIEKILNCLRLFRVGSVFSMKYQMRPTSFLASGGGTISSSQRLAAKYKYPITKQDIPKLRDLIGKIKSLLPKDILQLKLGKTDPIAIALQRYNDALLKSESIESRITSVITCFEALYLKAEERMELSHRLSQRASALLKAFDFKPLEIYNTLIQAYDVRSTFIHGSQIESEERENAAKIAEKILEYARFCYALWEIIGNRVC